MYMSSCVYVAVEKNDPTAGPWYNIPMNTNTTIIALITLIIGLGSGYTFGHTRTTPPQHTAPNEHSMHGQMNQMMSGLAGKTGDDFDNAFLNEMIIHHEGAVDMAVSALDNAKHEEIKLMAKDIISAQTSEIQQMKEWKKAWYGQE